MKPLTSTINSKKQIGKAVLFALLILLIIAAVAPQFTSEVYGASQVHIRYIDYDGKVLKEGDVTPGAILEPPANPKHDDMIFLGWDKKFDGHTVDTDITAVYDLIMETTKEDKGKLAKPKTANPPTEQTTPSTTSGSVNQDTQMVTTGEGITTDDSITTPNVIKPKPTPKGAGIDVDEDKLSTPAIALMILSVVIALALIIYIVFMVYRKRQGHNN